MNIEQNIETIRANFPALRKEHDGRPAVFFDGPAGTQVPQSVIDAFGNYLTTCNANHGGLFLTSRENDELVHRAHGAFADFIGADDPDEIIFGQNMTSLTFAFSRALAKTWNAGDEIVVTRLDHDANVTPWVLAAQDAGVVVRYVELETESYTLDMESLQENISEKTRLVAIGAASNATGGVNPVKQISAMAHEVGALVFVDAVHYGPHGLIDVVDWDCDFLCCSAYKFFGPHLGIFWGRRQLLESLTAYKLRPAEDELPGKWMTGTQSFESIAAGMACVDYLCRLGDPGFDPQNGNRRNALKKTFESIVEYEQKISARMLDQFAQIEGLKVYGITDPNRLSERFPTFSVAHSHVTTTQLAQSLCDRGVFVWHGNYYALQFTESLGLEPEGMVRIGLVHYNTLSEIDRMIEALQESLASTPAKP